MYNESNFMKSVVEFLTSRGVDIHRANEAAHILNKQNLGQLPCPLEEPYLSKIQQVEQVSSFSVRVFQNSYSLAFQQFLNLGLQRNVAELLASGHNRFDLISHDIDNPVRQKAWQIYDKFFGGTDGND